MAKTDDPIYDLQQKVIQQRKEIETLKEHQGYMFRFMTAANTFLTERYPLDIPQWEGVVAWLDTKVHKEQEAQQLQDAIQSLQSKGYVVTATPNNDPPKSCTLSV